MINRMTTHPPMAQLQKQNLALLLRASLQHITLLSSPRRPTPPDTSTPGETVAHILCLPFTRFSLQF